MASRLLSMGFPVTVYNRTREKAREICRFRSFCRGHPSRGIGASGRSDRNGR